MLLRLRGPGRVTEVNHLPNRVHGSRRTAKCHTPLGKLSPYASCRRQTEEQSFSYQALVGWSSKGDIASQSQTLKLESQITSANVRDINTGLGRYSGYVHESQDKSVPFGNFILIGDQEVGAECLSQSTILQSGLEDTRLTCFCRREHIRGAQPLAGRLTKQVTRRTQGETTSPQVVEGIPSRSREKVEEVIERAA